MCNFYWLLAAAAAVVLCLLCRFSQAVEMAAPPEAFELIDSVVHAFEKLDYDDSNSFSVTQLSADQIRCRLMDDGDEQECTDSDDDLDLEFVIVTSTIFTAPEIIEYPDLQLYPAFAVAVVPFYNIPELDGSITNDRLALTPAVLAKIFQSRVTRWNDPAIRSLNPGLNATLPDEEIRVCVHAETSGLTEIFKAFLAGADPGFAAAVGVSANASWGNLTGAHYADGEKGIMSYVLSEPYSLSYFSFNTEKLNADGTPRMKIIRDSGDEVEISHTSIQAAVNNLGSGLRYSTAPNISEAIMFTQDLVNSDLENAWPIVGFSYFALRKDSSPHGHGGCARYERAAQFLHWFYGAHATVSHLLGAFGAGDVPDLHTGAIEEHFWEHWHCEDEHLQGVFKRSITVGGPIEFHRMFSLFQAMFLGTYADDKIIEIEYKDYTGSSNSVYNDILDGSIEIGISYEHQSGSSNSTTSVLELPLFAAQLAVITNLCGVTSAEEGAGCLTPINITAEILAGIFEGTITHWDHPGLLALNPSLPPLLAAAAAGNDDGMAAAAAAFRPVAMAPAFDVARLFEGLLGRRLRRPFAVNGSFAVETSVYHVEAMVYGNQYSIGVVYLTSDMVTSLADRLAVVHFVDESDGHISYPADPGDEELLECMRDGLEYSSSTDLVNFGAQESLEDCRYPFIVTYNLFMQENYEKEALEGTCAQAPLLAAKFADFLLHDGGEGARGIFELYKLVSLLEHVDGLYEYVQWRADHVTCGDDGTTLLLGAVAERRQTPALQVVAWCLSAVVIMASTWALMWVKRHQKMRILRFSQPMFLYIMLCGCIVYSLTLVLLAIDERQFPAKTDSFRRISHGRLTGVCQTIPWLYTTGFVMIFGSLLGKTWRIKEIFINPALKKKKIKNETVLKQLGAALFTFWSICLVWTFTAPLDWHDHVIVLDPENGVSPTDWYARCGSDQLHIFLPLVLAVQLGCFLYGTVLSYKIRTLKDDFSETTSINLAMFTNMQGLLFVVMLGYLGKNSPDLLLITTMCFILLGGCGTVAMIIVPKMWIIRQARKDPTAEKHQGKNNALASHTTSSDQAAATHASLRRSSGLAGNGNEISPTQQKKKLKGGKQVAPSPRAERTSISTVATMMDEYNMADNHDSSRLSISQRTNGQCVSRSKTELMVEDSLSRCKDNEKTRRDVGALLLNQENDGSCSPVNMSSGLSTPVSLEAVTPSRPLLFFPGTPDSDKKAIKPIKTKEHRQQIEEATKVSSALNSSSLNQADLQRLLISEEVTLPPLKEDQKRCPRESLQRLHT